jgi:hypothetical protein
MVMTELILFSLVCSTTGGVLGVFLTAAASEFGQSLLGANKLVGICDEKQNKQ